MEQIAVIWPIITGSLIVPLVAWIKNRVPVDFPIGIPIITAALNCVAVWILGLIFAPDTPYLDLWPLIGLGQMTTQAGHALKKTGDKVIAGKIMRSATE